MLSASTTAGIVELILKHKKKFDKQNGRASRALSVLSGYGPCEKLVKEYMNYELYVAVNRAKNGKKGALAKKS